MMAVNCFVYALAEDHEVCDVFGLGDLLVLQDHSVEVAIEEVMDEAHVDHNFECFFGDLYILEMGGIEKVEERGACLPPSRLSGKE
jgi:hypothetical protein